MIDRKGIESVETYKVRERERESEEVKDIHREETKTHTKYR